MSKKTLYLIDATAFCYRAFYALKGLSTSFGQPTNAIYGFINMLNKILKEKKPEYIAACFDVSRDTFRARKFAEYKVNRPPMPEGLSSQLPLIKQVIRAQGLAFFEKQGFEADDLIATIARKAKEEGFFTLIVSSDKDILQLVDEETTVLSPSSDAEVSYTAQEVLNRFGVAPERITDYLALTGDDADNIPGIRGIGEKTATHLLKEFGSLDQLLEGVLRIKQEKIRQILSDNLDKIRLNKELVKLDEGVELDFDLESLRLKEPDKKELFRLFKYLEFKKFVKEFAAEEEGGKNIQVSELQDGELKDLLLGQGELIVGVMSADEIALGIGDRLFRMKGRGENLKNVLEDPGIKKISHDLKRLRVTLAREGLVLDGLNFDTMVAAYLLNPSKPAYSLPDVAWDYLGRLPSKDMDSAAATDLIRLLRPKLENELKEKELLELFEDLEMPLVMVLAQMEERGIKLDLKVLTLLSQKIETRLIQLKKEVYRTSGSQFNINSPKQLRQVLFEQLKLPVVKRSKTGPSTDEEVLKSLADRHPLPKLLLEYRQLTKLKNTYVDTLPALIDEKTGRLHTSFNQTATETGRLSSSNPNLQNIPIKTDIGKILRKAIVASDDKSYLLSCDYSQIELRVLAHLSKDTNLIAAFRQNKDIHMDAACLIYGLEEDGVTEAMREVAKRVNFGIVYGLTSFGLSRDLGISLDDAQRFIDAYFARYPGVQAYIQEQISKAAESGFVTTLLGRRRYIPEINNKNQGLRQFAQRQAVNTPIQGTASDLIKLAMIEIHQQIRARKLDAKMVLQIHDELVFDVQEKELAELKEIAKDRMENVLKLDVPIKVDIKKGRNWLEMEECR